MFNLISSAFGNITTWVIIGMSVVILGMAEYIHVLKADIKVCEVQKKSVEHDLALQNLVIESNKVDIVSRSKEVNATQIVKEIEYQTRIQVIEKWRTKYVEVNATCSDAISYINNYNY